MQDPALATPGPRNVGKSAGRRSNGIAILSQDLRKRLQHALIFDVELIDLAEIGDEITGIVERHVREQFALTAAAYDLAFTTMKREIWSLLAVELDEVICLDDALYAVREALSGDEGSS